MSTREQLISEIKALQEKIERDKEKGKKSFKIARDKLDESRQQTEKIQNMDLDEVLEGMEGELPDEARKLAKEANDTEKELESLEKSVQKNQENDSLIEQARSNLQVQLKELLHAETREEVLHEIQELSQIPEKIRELKAKLIEMDDTESETAAVKKETETEIEKEIKQMNQRIEAIATDAKGKNDKNYYIIATIHNTLWRLITDSNNEEFYLSHGRSAVWQARSVNTLQATFNTKRVNNNEEPDPRNFD